MDKTAPSQRGVRTAGNRTQQLLDSGKVFLLPRGTFRSSHLGDRKKKRSEMQTQTRMMKIR